MAEQVNIPGALQSLRALEQGLVQQSMTEEGLSELGQQTLDTIRTGGVGEGGWDTFLQGLTLNFSDEAIAGVQSFLGTDDEFVKALNQYRATPEGGELPPVSPYEASLALERHGIATTREQHPGRAMATEIAGAALPGIVAGLFTGGATVPATLGRAAAIGAGYGGLSGFGQGEGAKDRLVDTGVGTALGTAAAPVFNVGARILGSGWKGLAGYGPETRASLQADKILREGMESEGLSPAQITSAMGAADKPLSLIDVGDSFTSMARAVKSMPGEGKSIVADFLKGRDREYFNRVTSDLHAAFGKKARLFDELEALSLARQRMGNKLYGEAFKHKIPVTKDLSILLSQRPSINRAWSNAYELAAEEGVKLPRLALNDRGMLVDSAGDVVTHVDTRFLHYLKMGLDREVFTGKMPTSGVDRTLLGAVKKTRKELLEHMDSNNPAYTRARNKWAGSMQIEEAMDTGRSLYKADVDTLRREIQDMSVNEREAFRIGAMQAMFDKIESAVETGNIAKGLLRSRKHKQLLALTFDQTEHGQKAANRFINNLEHEIDMKARSGFVLGQSATAETQAFQTMLREGAQRDVALPDNLGGSVIAMLRENAAELEEQQLRRVNKLLAEALTETNPAVVNRLMGEAESPGKWKTLLGLIREKPAWLVDALTQPRVAGQLSGSYGPQALESFGLLGS